VLDFVPVVLLDGRMYLGRMHGIARYAYSLVEAVARLRPEWRVLVWERQGAFASLAAERANIRPVPASSPPLSLREQWEWPRCVRTHGPDLVHATSIAVSSRVDAPQVITVPDLIPWHLPRRAWHRLYRLYFEGILKPALRRARAVIAYSQASAQDVSETLGVPGNKLHVCPLGVDAHYSPGGPPGDYFLCVANPKPHKNVALLLDAWARYRGPYRLVLVCPEAAWLDERLARCGPRVERRFPVAEAELPALYRSAQALLFPSYFEGFGLPALEAMACGTPVMAAHATSLPEVVGDSGWLFDPRDSRELLACLEAFSPARRAEKAAAALERARAFTWEACARAHLQVYESALG